MLSRETRSQVDQRFARLELSLAEAHVITSDIEKLMYGKLGCVSYAVDMMIDRVSASGAFQQGMLDPRAPAGVAMLILLPAKRDEKLLHVMKRWLQNMNGEFQILSPLILPSPEQLPAGRRPELPPVELSGSVPFPWFLEADVPSMAESALNVPGRGQSVVLLHHMTNPVIRSRPMSR